MKTLVLATAALALSTGFAMADAHGKTIRMGTEGAYPPYNFLNDAGEVDGFEREVGDAHTGDDGVVVARCEVRDLSLIHI